MSNDAFDVATRKVTGLCVVRFNVFSVFLDYAL